MELNIVALVSVKSVTKVLGKEILNISAVFLIVNVFKTKIKKLS